MRQQKKGISLGHVALAILFLGGVWLLIAPTWVGFSHQVLASRIDEWAGVAVIVVSVVSFFLQWSFGLAELLGGRSSNSLSKPEE